jgi:hypothetical protein
MVRANSPKLLEEIPPNHRAKIAESDAVKTLDMSWFPKSKKLVITINQIRFEGPLMMVRLMMANDWDVI